MRPPYRTTFAKTLPGIGEVEVETLVTPGLAPRYGEDPDPGHDTEYEIGDVYKIVNGVRFDIDPDEMIVRASNSYGFTLLTDYLIDCAPSAIGEVQP